MLYNLKAWIFFVGLTGSLTSIVAQTAIPSENVFKDETSAEAWRNKYALLTSQNQIKVMRSPMQEFHIQLRGLQKDLNTYLVSNGFAWGGTDGRGSLQYTLYVDEAGMIKLFSYQIRPTDLAVEKQRQLEGLLNAFFSSKKLELDIQQAFAYDGQMGFSDRGM